MELTVHTGFPGSETEIHIAWYDFDNVPQSDTVTIAVRPQDAPRVIDVKLNGVPVATLNSKTWKIDTGNQNSDDDKPSAEYAAITGEMDGAAVLRFLHVLLDGNIPSELAGKMAVAYARGIGG